MTRKTEKPTVFEFTHLLSMHAFIKKAELRKSEYKYERIVDKTEGVGWKWKLTVKRESQSTQSKEPSNV